MRMLRDQLGQWVYTVHRLDRATSGVLVFALDSETAAALSRQFAQREVRKYYLAVVRGYLPESGVIERALRQEKHLPPAPAVTRYERMNIAELQLPLGNFPTVRYSLVAVFPQTGRKNQIRRHFAGTSHPIIGDVQFGDGRHNRLFREQFGSHRLLLHAHRLEIRHPQSGQLLSFTAPLQDAMCALFHALGWSWPAESV